MDDPFVTNPVPQRIGDREVQVIVRPKMQMNHARYGVIVGRNVDARVLASSSVMFRRLLEEVADAPIGITWPNHEIVEAYVQWLETRVFNRVASSVQHTPKISELLPTEHPLATYNSVYRDIWQLINMWLFGFHVEDSLFMDTTMARLEELLNTKDNEAESNMQTFLYFLEPRFVRDIWENTEQDEADYRFEPKLRTFIIDTIALHATPACVRGFLATMAEARAYMEAYEGQSQGEIELATAASACSKREADADDTRDNEFMYPAEFVAGLASCLEHTIMVSDLPVGVKIDNQNQVRVILPQTPYPAWMVGRSGGAEIQSFRELNVSERNLFLRELFADKCEKPSYKAGFDMYGSAPVYNGLGLQCDYHEHEPNGACPLHAQDD